MRYAIGIQIVSAILCGIVGVLLMQVRANQEFFNLIPTDLQHMILPLKTGTLYDQTFTVQRKSLSRLGLYMRPMGEISDPSSTVHIELIRDGKTIGYGDIPAIFIEHGGPAYVTFAEPIVTKKGEQITIRITVPESLSGLIAIRQRMHDANFVQRDIVFMINGNEQEHVIAFNMFESTAPAFIRQIGGILLAFGLSLLLIKRIRKYPSIAAIAVLFIISLLDAISARDASMSYSMFAAAVFIILLVMWVLLRIAGRNNLAAVFGAAVFACSTWLPLHMITGGNIGNILSVRDALIDPNQIAITHGAGLYTGMLASTAAIIGIFAWITLLVRKRTQECEIETVIAIIGLVAAYIAFVPSPFANGHAGILVSFAIAWFASFGMHRVQRFLGTRDIVVRVILSGLAILTILDLLYVTARSFTYGLGV